MNKKIKKFQQKCQLKFILIYYEQNKIKVNNIKKFYKK